MGDLLRKQRGGRGLKLRNLAVLMEVSAHRVTAWENDEAVPSVEEWSRLARLLDLPVNLAEAKPNSGL